MLDPFIPPPPLLSRLVEPIASALSLPTLPLHAHEVLIAFTLYHVINRYISPAVSSRLFPNTYANLDRRTKINWDVHSVSLCQSLLINTLALWVIWTDEERRQLDWRGRVWGYTGASGLVQGFAAGYFIWDLTVTARYVGIFGWGMVAHAVSALAVFSFGFRPFVNYYGPIFILYELSSPFLNFHWYFDKLNMTGSNAQLYNGLILLSTFFGCRLVWGTYQTTQVFQDVWKALQVSSVPDSHFPSTYGSHNATASDPTFNQSKDATAEIMRFAGPQLVPLWLAVTYLSANVVLTGLNFFWFKKMIDAVRKRFQKPRLETVKEEKDKKGVPSIRVDEKGYTVLSVAETKVRRRQG